MKDLGSLHFFLSISVVRSPKGFFLSQQKYAADLLDRAGMTDCKLASTPINTNPKVSYASGMTLSDGSIYRSLVGALQYLTLTRPDIAYAVQQVCLHMHDPRGCHMSLVKRILRYIKGSLHYGLQLYTTPSMTLLAYCDANWANCPDTRRSTLGYCIFLGDNLILWSSKRQPMVSHSSVGAEYMVVANAVAECCWLRQLLAELHCPLQQATVAYYDNVFDVYMSSNPVQH